MGTNYDFEAINADYRATVARRRAERAREELRWQSANLFIQRLVAVIQLLLCIIGFGILANYAGTHPQTFHSTMATVSFIFAELSFLTYVVFFPKYFPTIE